MENERQVELLEHVEKPVKEKRRLIKAKKLQKKFGINCEVGFVLTFKDDVELHNVFGELQEKLGHKVKRITFEKGQIVSVVIDKNDSLLS